MNPKPYLKGPLWVVLAGIIGMLGVGQASRSAGRARHR
jgi:hypothetical protein